MRHPPCHQNSGSNKVVRFIELFVIVGMCSAIVKHRPSGQRRHHLFASFFLFFSNYLAACRIQYHLGNQHHASPNKLVSLSTSSACILLYRNADIGIPSGRRHRRFHSLFNFYSCLFTNPAACLFVLQFFVHWIDRHRWRANWLTGQGV